MEQAATILWHIPIVMSVLLVAGLMMGQRHVGELSVFDLLTGIAIGAVAGAGVVDVEIPVTATMTGILGLALLHFAVTWLTKRWAGFGRLATFEPIVVVKQGKPLFGAMRKVRLALADLLPLLREKDIFDLRQVEYAILETDGKLTVIKSNQPFPMQGLPRAVCVDGLIQLGVLRDLGWDEARLRAELARQGQPGPEGIFLATLDEGGHLHAVPREPGSTGPEIHH